MHYALNYSDLEEYENQGDYIGAHGYYHLFVNERLFKRDIVSFKREIFKPKEVLDRNLSNNIIIFAYPYGSYSDVTIEYLKKAGYSYAFTIRPGPIKIPLSKNTNAYSLPRYLVTKASWKQIYRFLKYNARQCNHFAKG
jgi:peptidoglycan/xylan/chitin deacetylase (PgdA/CDA1 family)